MVGTPSIQPRGAPSRGLVVKALCGVEVSTDELQRIAPEIAWIRESTCIACWQVLASRQ
ncbi:hypothetical protein [Saccharopolyspora hattusasensis]|uniref:hypothetical protein n=1 Tax=Saccharopolyspora hattusasensis TaxID=1128679 RepID=UPI003D989792